MKWFNRIVEFAKKIFSPKSKQPKEHVLSLADLDKMRSKGLRMPGTDYLLRREVFLEELRTRVVDEMNSCGIPVARMPIEYDTYDVEPDEKITEELPTLALLIDGDLPDTIPPEVAAWRKEYDEITEARKHNFPKLDFVPSPVKLKGYQYTEDLEIYHIVCDENGRDITDECARSDNAMEALRMAVLNRPRYINLEVAKEKLSIDAEKGEMRDRLSLANFGPKPVISKPLVPAKGE